MHQIIQQLINIAIKSCEIFLTIIYNEIIRKNKQFNNKIIIKAFDILVNISKLVFFKFCILFIDIINKINSIKIKINPNHLYIYLDKIYIKKNEILVKKLIK